MACLGGHLGSRRWHPGLPALCPPPRARGGQEGTGVSGEGGTGVWGVGCCALGAKRGVSAGSLPSGCSPEPQGTPSTVWVLQGEEGKPQHGADVLGKGPQATTHSLTLPGLRVWGEMPQLSPARFHPTSCTPAMLDTPAPFYPPWRCPTSTGTAA